MVSTLPNPHECLMLMRYRLTFVATTVLAALHIRSTPRNDAAPPNMAGV
jgi:hypothetical protein